MIRINLRTLMACVAAVAVLLAVGSYCARLQPYVSRAIAPSMVWIRVTTKPGNVIRDREEVKLECIAHEKFDVSLITRHRGERTDGELVHSEAAGFGSYHIVEVRCVRRGNRIAITVDGQESWHTTFDLEPDCEPAFGDTVGSEPQIGYGVVLDFIEFPCDSGAGIGIMCKERS